MRLSPKTELIFCESFRLDSIRDLSGNKRKRRRKEARVAQHQSVDFLVRAIHHRPVLLMQLLWPRVYINRVLGSIPLSMVPQKACLEPNWASQQFGCIVLSNRQIDWAGMHIHHLHLILNNCMGHLLGQNIDSFPENIMPVSCYLDHPQNSAAIH